VKLTRLQFRFDKISIARITFILLKAVTTFTILAMRCLFF